MYAQLSDCTMFLSKNNHLNLIDINIFVKNQISPGLHIAK